MSLLVTVDLNWILQFIVTVLIVAVGLLHLVKNTASNYFLADDTDHDNDDVSDWPATTTAVTPPTTVKTTTAAINNNTVSRSEIMATVTTKAVEKNSCAVCGCQTTKWCAGCKIVMYCSGACQTSHWKSVHKTECKDFQLFGKSIIGRRRGCSAISLVASGESSKSSNQLKKILFPYENFVKFFNWDKPGFPPCGLLNCGNSCFANAVLQCLAYTKPLVAFLLETGHRRECRRNDWCFLCEFQTHVERANQSLRPFSPINILSRLPNIGGNLGYGKQEDAHEFMRFAIDTMQSVCLDEFGGEKAIHPTSQETTLIQHIFGGHLQSQVICTKCNNISNQFENMMDLTVEIQGDAASLEDCLDQFTAKEWLHGDNMYKCDGCDDYVMAWKRLTVRRAPNILTIALKRFQSGRFGKLNKRVTFPETLDLSPYMSETAEDDNVYKLYAVIVHVDMLNASFFGHYICYIKDFRGKWYRVDDCKVIRVDLDEVLSQGAYMLLYSRISARRSCLYPAEPPRKEELQNMEVDLSSTHPVQCPSVGESADTLVNSVIYTSDSNSQSEVAICEVELSSRSNCENTKEDLEMVDFKENCPVSLDDELCEGSLPVAIEEAAVPLGHTHALASTNVPTVAGYLSEVDIIKEIPSSPVSNVLDDSGGSNRILPYFSLRDSSDQDPLATQNHVDVKEEMPCDVSAAVSSSKEILEASRTADSRDKTGKAAREMPFSYGIPSSNGFQDAARKSDGKKSVAKINPVFSRGFLDRKLVATKNPVDLKEEMPLHLSAAVSIANEALEGAKIADSRDKTGKAAPGMLPSDGVPSSNGRQDTARKSDGRSSAAKVKPISHPGFFEKDSVAIQNHVDVKEEMPADVHAAISSSNEVLVETKTADSRDKTGKAAREIPSSDGVRASNGFRDSARKSDRKHSAVKVKPLFHPGFLDKRPQNKHIKREREISAEQISGSNIHCRVNEVCKPNLYGQFDVAMTNGDEGHLGYYNGISADVLGKRDELIEKNTPMEMDTTEIDEP